MAEVTVTFDQSIQPLGPLREAAYRLIGVAACHIEQDDGALRCTLHPQPGIADDADALRRRFLDLVTDENLRAKVSAETEGVRNVVLALAFGALARAEAATSGQ